MNIWQSYKQERDCLVHFERLANTLLKDGKGAQNNHFLLVTLLNINRFSFFFTRRFSNKFSLIWLLTTPQYLKYVATLPCSLLLTTGFADINFSQGSVGTHARCDGIFSKHLTANLSRNLPVKHFLKSLKI